MSAFSFHQPAVKNCPPLKHNKRDTTLTRLPFLVALGKHSKLLSVCRSCQVEALQDLRWLIQKHFVSSVLESSQHYQIVTYDVRQQAAFTLWHPPRWGAFPAWSESERRCPLSWPMPSPSLKHATSVRSPRDATKTVILVKTPACRSRSARVPIRSAKVWRVQCLSVTLSHILIWRQADPGQNHQALHSAILRFTTKKKNASDDAKVVFSSVKVLLSKCQLFF